VIVASVVMPALVWLLKLKQLPKEELNQLATPMSCINQAEISSTQAMEQM
jgi:hypothetical protein